MNRYIHGYSDRESKRLSDQAGVLDELLHGDTIFPEGSSILEVGCGVGSQTKIIAPRNPACRFTCMDISPESLEAAEQLARSLNISNVLFEKGDIMDLRYEPGSFDHVFICFVLEHLRDPVQALVNARKVVKNGGTVTVIEGDHGSAYFYPWSVYARNVIDCQVILQGMSGGNANIGRELYPLLLRAGFHSCSVSPRMVYADPGRPRIVEGFTRRTFTAMISGVREQALHHSLISGEDWDRGIRDLELAAGDDGVFCYTFFKGTGVKE